MVDLRHFHCNLCDALCGLTATVEGDRITGIRGNPDDVFSRGHMCPKGAALREVEDDPDRLRVPLRRTRGGAFSPIGWEEALGETAHRLRAIQAAHGKDSVAIYVGNPNIHSHGAALGAQLLTLALGSRNRFDPNSQDSAPRLFACMQVYGDGLSIPVPDIDNTDYLLILGGNPATSNGSMMALGDARGRLRGVRERGGRMVVIDPRKTETAEMADAHYFIRPGGDAALLLAMLNVLFTDGLVDERNISLIASGLSELRAIAARFSPERVAGATGMTAETISTLAREFAGARRAVLHGRIGTCQNEFGPVASWLIEAVNVVTGNFDRPGGAMFPRPAADIGGVARALVGNHYDRYRSRVRGLPEFLGALPSAVMAEEMETPGAGQVKALVTVAGNPVLSTPNGERLARALPGLDFMVSVDLYLNETTRHADIVLPPVTALHATNYDLVLLRMAVRNVARFSEAVLPRAAGTLDDWEILSELSLRIGAPKRLQNTLRRLSRGLPDRVVDWLLRTGHYGDRFIPGHKGLSLSRLRKRPHGIDLGPLIPSRGQNVRTPDGLVNLAPPVYATELLRLEAWMETRPRADELLLIGRRHMRSMNSWLHNAHSLVKGPSRAQLLMHPEDAARLGLTGGMRVRIASRVGAVSARLGLSNEVMRGVVSLPHGFGHNAAADTLHIAGGVEGPNVNALTDDQHVEGLIGTSVLNGVPVTVRECTD